jgi:hypothetical protein
VREVQANRLCVDVGDKQDQHRNFPRNRLKVPSRVNTGTFLRGPARPDRPRAEKVFDGVAAAIGPDVPDLNELASLGRRLALGPGVLGSFRGSGRLAATDHLRHRESPGSLLTRFLCSGLSLHRRSLSALGVGALAHIAPILK